MNGQSGCAAFLQGGESLTMQGRAIIEYGCDSSNNSLLLVWKKNAQFINVEVFGKLEKIFAGISNHGVE